MMSNSPPKCQSRSTADPRHFHSSSVSNVSANSQSGVSLNHFRIHAPRATLSEDSAGSPVASSLPMSAHQRVHARKEPTGPHNSGSPATSGFLTSVHHEAIEGLS